MNLLKSTILALALFIMTYTSFAQPNEVLRITKDCKDYSWYENQAKEWKKEINSNPYSENAWFNYFKANRYRNMFDTKTDFNVKSKIMTDLLDSMKKYIPDSFTYNYCMYWNGGNNFELSNYLFKAYSIKQDYSELSPDFIVYYEVNFKPEMRDFFIKEWYNTREIAPDLLNFAYNLLMSLDNNAIIFTGGDNDTYPLWMVQSVLGIRKDVTVLNSSLIMIDSYRKGIFEKVGLPNISKPEPQSTDDKNWEIIMSRFFKELTEKNTNRPIYFALTLHPDLTSKIQDKLYLTGLAYKYSSKSFDNIAALKKNWSKFRLDYLNFDFYSEKYPFSNRVAKDLNMTYAAPAYVLQEHYAESGEKEKAAKFEELIARLSSLASQNKFESQTISSESTKTKEIPAPKDILISISPNPARNQFKLDFNSDNPIEITIIDLDGKELNNFKNIKPNQLIDVSSVPAGAYFLKIFIDKQVVSKSIVIEK